MQDSRPLPSPDLLLTDNPYFSHRNHLIKISLIMRLLADLFNRNKLWAEDIRSKDPDFFKKLSEQQFLEGLENAVRPFVTNVSKSSASEVRELEPLLEAPPRKRSASEYRPVLVHYA